MSDHHPESVATNKGGQQSAAAEREERAKAAALISNTDTAYYNQQENLDNPPQDTNAITGADWLDQAQNKVNNPGAIFGENLSCESPREGEYGKYQITQTQCGHKIIMNCTLGSESIVIRHSSGSGIEMRADGSILISGKGVVLNSQGATSLVLEGNTNIETDGDLNFKAGNVNIKASGKFNVDAGSMNTKTTGTTQVTSKDYKLTATGAIDTLAVKQSSSTYVGGYDLVGRKNLRIVNDGEMGIHSSGIIGISAEARAYMSSNEIGITGQQLDVIGNNGTIGGENIISYNKNSISNGTVYGQTSIVSPMGTIDRLNSTSAHAGIFVGNLNGVAKIAMSLAPYSGSPEAPSTTDDAYETTLPTASEITAQQNTADTALKRVDVKVSSLLNQITGLNEAGLGEYYDQFNFPNTTPDIAYENGPEKGSRTVAPTTFPGDEIR